MLSRNRALERAFSMPPDPLIACDPWLSAGSKRAEGMAAPFGKQAALRVSQEDGGHTEEDGAKQHHMMQNSERHSRSASMCICAASRNLWTSRTGRAAMLFRPREAPFEARGAQHVQDADSDGVAKSRQRPPTRLTCGRSKSAKKRRRAYAHCVMRLRASRDSLSSAVGMHLRRETDDFTCAASMSAIMWARGHI